MTDAQGQTRNVDPDDLAAYLTFSASRGTFSPDTYGARGDGVTNDTAAFIAMTVAVTAADGGVIEFRPGATYVIGQQTANSDALVASTGYTYQPVDFFKFLNITGDIIIRGNGATLKAPDGYKFGTFAAASAGGSATSHAQPYTGNEIAALINAMLHFEGCSGNIYVENLNLDGNVANANVGGPWGDTGWQIPGSGVYVKNHTGCWRLKNVTAFHHPLDGLLVDDPGAANTPLSGSGTDDCNFYENGRQGLSLVGGVGHKFVRTKFNRTRRNTGTVQSAPGASIDIEAEGIKHVKDIEFIDCEAVDSVGPALLDGGSSNNSNITWRGGRLIGTTNYSYYSAGMKGVRFEDGFLILGEMNNLVGGAQGERFSHGTFSNELALSPTGTIHLPNGFNYFVSGVYVDDCEFVCAHAGGLAVGSVDSSRFNNCRFRAKLGRLDVYGRFSGDTWFIENGGTAFAATPGAIVGVIDTGEAEDDWTHYAVTGPVSMKYPSTRNLSTALTSAATITPDFSKFRTGYTVTLDTNFTLANPTSPKIGRRGKIVLTQDATGSRLLSAVGSWWKFPGGIPTLSTPAGSVDVIDYEVVSATRINATIQKAFA